jgi:tryptophan synthase beta chain
MVKVSYEQKPYRRVLMHTWGGEVYPSPTERTNAGREALKKNPNSLGSLGLAISEAVEAAATSDDTNYALGSVLNHVLLHQTVIGLETQKQLELVEDKADIVLGCVGGGSNFGGMLAPFAKEKMDGKSDVQIIAIEPKSCPTLTKGQYVYDFGDTMGLTPAMLMYTLGHTFEPPGIHAGGLRYHGDAPILCNLVKHGGGEARAYNPNPDFEAAVLFARTEGIIPAPETSHAVRGLVDEALKCKETGEEKAIVCCFSGHGHFDLAAYDAYLEGKLQDYEYPEEKIVEALKDLPKVSPPK